MAIIHQFREVRQYYSVWIVSCDVIDNVKNTTYYYEWNFPSEVTEQSQVVQDQITKAKAEVQFDILCNENKMNESEDVGIVNEHLVEIRNAIIRRIRNNPNATLAQAQTYITNTFPNHVINFTNLYQKYLAMLRLTTWAEFKDYVINKKFREID